MILLSSHGAVPAFPEEVLWTTHEWQDHETANEGRGCQTNKKIALDLERACGEYSQIE
jgi:hypothetical protein